MGWTLPQVSEFWIASLICATFMIGSASSVAQGTSSTMDSYRVPNTTTSPAELLLSIDPDSAAPRNSEGDIIELSNGRLALVYSKFSGGKEDHSAARLAMRTSSDGGRSWSADKSLLDNEGGVNVMSVSLVPSRDDGILLFYLRKDSAATSCALFVRRSTDDLQTLSEAVLVTTLPGYNVVNNDRVIRLKSGRLLVPVALHTDSKTVDNLNPKFEEKGAMIAYYSDDDGKTWQRDMMPVPAVAERTLHLQEPGVVELADGRVMMYIRTGHGAQYASYSKDGGETWTVPEPMALVSPLSPATIERVPDSNLLVAVWNDHSGRWPFKKENRTPLCLAVSKDEGKTWSPSQMVESDPNGWYCYTSMSFINDRLILSYCAGQGRANGLNRLKVSEVPLAWVKYLGR